MPGRGKLPDNTLGICTFWYAFNICRLDAQFFFHSLAADIMTICPAMVTNRTYVNKSHRCILGHGQRRGK